MNKTISETNNKSILKCKNVLNTLCSTYVNDAFIIGKLEHYITEQLPKTLDTMKKDHEHKLKRKIFLEQEKEKFICKFLNENMFFYISATNQFIQYDKNNFILSTEDNIQHQILTKITSEKTLMEWKYKIKTEIMKEIKSSNFIKTPIPESDTIQNILNNIFPTLFTTKEWAKYFLTVIGDNILKKNNKFIYLANPSIKNLLTLISNETTKYFSTTINPVESIKLKFHQHNYENCRILDTNNTNQLNYTNSENYIKQNFLNFIAVAVYYSVKHESSDNYIKTNHRALASIQKRVFYLNHNDIDKIISSFLIKHTVMTNIPNSNLHWNDVLFMWKYYLQSLNLPNIIFHNTLKTKLQERMSFDKEKEIFINCKSDFFDSVELFKTFWCETIITNKPNDDLEIEELEFLFHIWCKKKDNGHLILKRSNFNVIDTISHFYKSITINNNKYIVGIQSKEWNKLNVIKDFLSTLKNKYKKENNSKPISFDNVYKEYCKNQQNQLICSKQYFKKKIVTLIDIKHIEENIILHTYWS